MAPVLSVIDGTLKIDERHMNLFTDYEIDYCGEILVIRKTGDGKIEIFEKVDK